jgi:hypothetical protein
MATESTMSMAMKDDKKMKMVEEQGGTSYLSNVRWEANG